MKERLNDLRNKEVINIFDGTRLGYVFDVGLDTETAALTCLIIDGKSRFWGLLGREEDSSDPMGGRGNHRGGYHFGTVYTTPPGREKRKFTHTNFKIKNPKNTCYLQGDVL